VKKEELQARLRELDYQYEAQCAETARARRQVEKLKAEVEHLKTHWRPVPMTHEWQPRNPQCALCDDPRDSARHVTDG
jgi:hypothetical protein